MDVVELLFVFKAVTRDAEDKIDALQAKLASTSSGFSKAGAVVASAGTAMGVGLGIAGAASLKMGGDFEAGMTQLVTGAAEPQANIAGLKDGILKLAVDTGTPVKQLVEGMYQIASAGFHGSDGLNVLTASAEGAKVGNADLGVVANAVSSSLNAYHLPASKAADVTNTLIATVANGKMHMQDLAGAIGTIAPPAAAANVSLSEVGAAMATMTSQGTDADRAGQSLRYLLASLQGPTKAATKEFEALGVGADEMGTISDTASQQLQAMGVSTSDVANTLTHKGLIAALKEVTGAIGKQFPEGSAEYNAALRNVVGGTRGFTAALELTGGNMKDFEQKFHAINDAANSGQKGILGWDKIVGDFNTKVARLRETAETTGIKLGEALIPAAGKGADFLTSNLPKAVDAIGKAFQDHKGEIQSFAEGLRSGVADAISAVKAALSALSPLLKAVGGAFEELASHKTAVQAIFDVLVARWALVKGLGIAEGILKIVAAFRAFAGLSVGEQFSKLAGVGKPLEDLKKQLDALKGVQASQGVEQLSLALGTSAGAAAKAKAATAELKTELDGLKGAGAAGGLEAIGAAIAGAGAKASTAKTYTAELKTEIEGLKGVTAAQGISGLTTALGAEAAAASKAQASSGELKGILEGGLGSTAGKAGIVGLGAAVIAFAANVDDVQTKLKNGLWGQSQDAAMKQADAAIKSMGSDLSSSLAKGGSDAKSAVSSAFDQIKQSIKDTQGPLERVKDFFNFDEEARKSEKSISQMAAALKQVGQGTDVSSIKSGLQAVWDLASKDQEKFGQLARAADQAAQQMSSGILQSAQAGKSAWQESAQTVMSLMQSMLSHHRSITQGMIDDYKQLVQGAQQAGEGGKTAMDGAAQGATDLKSHLSAADDEVIKLAADVQKVDLSKIMKDDPEGVRMLEDMRQKLDDIGKKADEASQSGSKISGSTDQAKSAADALAQAWEKIADAIKKAVSAAASFHTPSVGGAGIGTSRPAVPGFQEGGYSAGGWALVGEGGPELVRFMGPGQILNNRDSMQMLGGLSQHLQQQHQSQQIQARAEQGHQEGKQKAIGVRQKSIQAEAAAGAISGKTASLESQALGKSAQASARMGSHPSQSAQDLLKGAGLLQGAGGRQAGSGPLSPFDFSKILGLQHGGSAPKGWHWVGEAGPELVHFPAAGHVLNNSDSRNFAHFARSATGFASGSTGLSMGGDSVSMHAPITINGVNGAADAVSAIHQAIGQNNAKLLASLRRR